MKTFTISSLLFCFLSTTSFAQNTNPGSDEEKVLIDNNKIKVTGYSGIPGGSVCGKGIHKHTAHLTMILTDAEVELTMANGKKVVQKVPAGTSFWSESETHSVKNVGTTSVKIQIVEIKS